MLRRSHAFMALSLAAAALLAGCPTSEDDGPLCNDSKCGPGVCLQFCGADAAKDTAAVTDAAKDGAPDGSDGGEDASDSGGDSATDADDGGG